MKTIITNFKKRYQKPLAITLLLCASSCWIQPAKAEGSKELVAEGGNRPYLEWSANGTTAGIARKTRLYVFVKKGDTINLGSSVTDSSSNNKEDIVFISPDGVRRACDVKSTGEGFIDTVAKETKGLEVTLDDGGYKPCTFLSNELDGFYEVQFHAPRETGDPPPKLASEQFPTDNAQGQTVAAWDITVIGSDGKIKVGRVLTNYVALNMGGPNLSLNSKLYVQTKDGYRYETDMNQLDPYGFIFFANSRGYINQTNQSTLYHSAKATDAALNLFQGNIKVQNPEVDDTATDITHLIFINRPDPLTLDAIRIPRLATPPSTPNNFKFTGLSGGSGNQTTVGKGGNFNFNSGTAGTYEIIIDTNADGKFDPSTDRVLQNPVLAGNNTVFWDGKKADGTNVLPLPGNQAYNTQITIRSGEYHFPMLDVENNNLGFKITLENPPIQGYPAIKDKNGEQIGKNTIYYNDENYTTNEDVVLDGSGATNPRNALAGVNSSSGKHQFSSGYGDFKGIDTWSYFPSAAVITPLVITSANVIGTKSVRFLTDADASGTVTVGDQVEYTITYSNATTATNDATNFIINDTLPSQLTFVSAAIASQTNGNNITINSSYNGSGALTNSGILRKEDTITIKVVATINSDNGGIPIANQASANFSTPETGGTTDTIVTDADAAGATKNPPAVNNYFFQTSDDSVNNGNDPTRTNDDDPTLIKVVPPKANLRLVKRVTNIGGVAITGFHDVTTGNNADDDNAPGWITSPAYLEGAFDSSDSTQIPVANRPKPGDEVEYKIYFLADGTVNSQNVKICDFIPNNSTYVRDSLQLEIGNTTYVTVTDAIGGTDTDGGFYDNAPFPTTCTGTDNKEGAVLINVGNVNFSTGAGTPANSYGSIRFRVKVK